MAAPNGLGHITRLLALARELAGRGVLRTVRVIASRWQRDRLPPEPWMSAVTVEWHEDVFTERAHTLFALPDLARSRKEWTRRLSGHPALGASSVVVSDNLALVLAARSDAMLSGSFLWQDVLPDGDFTRQERDLMARHRPSMLCNRWLASSSVLNQTSPVLTDWAAHPAQRRAPVGNGRPIIEVNVGTTGLVLDEAVELVQQLTSRCHDVQVTPALWKALGPAHRADVALRERVPAVAVARPGTQSVSEYVAGAVPMILLYERWNREMAGNARSLVTHGLAIDISCNGLPARTAAVEAAIETTRLVAARGRLMDQRCSGLAEMADQVQAHWSGRRIGLAAR